jgi:thiamine pyrophosphate-dependent acetolactate synthase large subunit-like protein
MHLTEPPLDFVKMAEAFRIWGHRVENPKELKKTFKEAMQHDGPAVVDVAMEGAVARKTKLTAANR